MSCERKKERQKYRKEERKEGSEIKCEIFIISSDYFIILHNLLDLKCLLVGFHEEQWKASLIGAFMLARGVAMITLRRMFPRASGHAQT